MTGVFRKRMSRLKSMMFETNVNKLNVRSTFNERTSEIGSFDYVIAINFWCMRILGVWPLKSTLFSNLRCGLIVIYISFFTLITMMELLVVKGWNEILHQALLTIPLIPMIARFAFIKVMKKNLCIILRTMIADWADYRHLSKRNQQIMVHYARKSRKFNVFSATLIGLTVTGYVLSPIGNAWSSDISWNTTTRSLPLKGLYPFPYWESPAFEILYIMQAILGFFVCSAIISVDYFLYTIVFHACGQFDILAATLKRYSNSSSAGHDYTQDVRSRTCACSSCVVKRHVHILNFMDITKRSFCNFHFIQLLGYCFNLVLYGRQLVVYIRDNDFNGIITCIVYVITTMYILFIYCYISECIIEKSESIGRIAHNLEWDRFPRDFNLPIIVARSRIPCNITAGNIVTMSFSYYTTILISTMSYISILVAFR